MEKILVTTDLSSNARAALRFAFDLARPRKAEVTVLHVYQLLRPFYWTEDDFDSHRLALIARVKAELRTSARQFAGAMGGAAVGFQVAMIENSDVTEGIMQFMAQGTYSYLCVSTRGLV